MNKIIRNRILGENLIIIVFGILILIGGAYLNIVVLSRLHFHLEFNP